MGKKKKNKKSKQPRIKPTPCSKCGEPTTVFILGMCPDCWSETNG